MAASNDLLTDVRFLSKKCSHLLPQNGSLWFITPKCHRKIRDEVRKGRKHCMGGKKQPINLPFRRERERESESQRERERESQRERTWWRSVSRERGGWKVAVCEELLIVFWLREVMIRPG
jgi:hypothetical protein